MANKQPDGMTEGLPQGLSKPAQRALMAAGYHRLEQLAGISEQELLKLHGVGPKSIPVLRQALAAQGLALAANNR